MFGVKKFNSDRMSEHNQSMASGLLFDTKDSLVNPMQDNKLHDR